MAMTLLVIQPVECSSGSIISVEWPDSQVIGSDTLIPWVIVRNDGALPASFFIRFSIRDPNNKWISGACSTTTTIKPGKEEPMWPNGVQITQSMPRGEYTGRVTLFSDYCSGYVLDEVKKPNAFEVF